MNICELLENNSNALDADEPPSDNTHTPQNSQTQAQLDHNQTTITVNTTDTTDSNDSVALENGAFAADGGGGGGGSGGNESEIFALFTDLDQNKHI